MSEIWKPVLGFEGRYEVSSFGRFKALTRQVVYTDGRIGNLKENEGIMLRAIEYLRNTNG